VELQQERVQQSFDEHKGRHTQHKTATLSYSLYIHSLCKELPLQEFWIQIFSCTRNCNVTEPQEWSQPPILAIHSNQRFIKNCL